MLDSTSIPLYLQGIHVYENETLFVMVTISTDSLTTAQEEYMEIHRELQYRLSDPSDLLVYVCMCATKEWP